MESKVDKNGGKSSITFTPLLPSYYKIVGLVILVLAFIPAIIVKIISIEMTYNQKETLKYLSINSLIFGMLLIGFSKDKVEDELTIALRTKSIVFAFLLAVTGVIFKPLTDLLFRYPIADTDGQDVVFGMLVVYLVIYYLQKKGR